MRKVRRINNGLRKVCDHPRSKWSKCPDPWHINLTHNGKPYRLSLDRYLREHRDELRAQGIDIVTVGVGINEHIESKTEAAKLFKHVSGEIVAGRFGQPTPTPVTGLTLRQLFDQYLVDYVEAERAATKDAYVWEANKICGTELPRANGEAVPLGAWRVVEIDRDVVKEFRKVRLGQPPRGTVINPPRNGKVGVNRDVRRLRAVVNWAVDNSVQGVTQRLSVKKLITQEPKRSRRLDADHDEEGRILAAANPFVRDVVEFDLETAMRSGEISGLQRWQLRGLTIEGTAITWARRSEIFLPKEKTKTKTDRSIPLSARAKRILEQRLFDPAGQPLRLDAFVFGTECGERVKRFRRAWYDAVLKAHGHTPTYSENTSNLSAESRAALRAIDLHFHDLRREAASRWLEGGVPLHTIQNWLGHASLQQTSTYLEATIKVQHDAMQQYDERRAAIQVVRKPFAKHGGNGGHQPTFPAQTGNETTNKDGLPAHPTIN